MAERVTQLDSSIIRPSYKGCENESNTYLSETHVQGSIPCLAMKGCSQVVKAWRAHNQDKPNSEVRILPPLLEQD